MTIRPTTHRHASDLVVLTTILVAGLTVSACKDEYRNRDDTAVSSAGSAMRGNAAIHTIDPWPPGAHKTQQNTDGPKAGNAIEVYRRVPPMKNKQTSTTKQP